MDILLKFHFEGKYSKSSNLSKKSEETSLQQNKGRDLKKEVAKKKTLWRLKGIFKGRNSCREITLMSRHKKDVNDVATPL